MADNANNTNTINNNSNELFLGNNIDLAALFGEDIQINEPLKQFSENEENGETNNTQINGNEKSKNIIINNIDIKSEQKDNEDILLSNLMEEFKEVGESFFDSLKEETNKKNNPKIKEGENVGEVNEVEEKNEEKGKFTKKKDIKELSFSDLAEEIKNQRNNPDFKKELKKMGLEFNIVDRNEDNEKSVTNILSCPICFENTNNQNIKMEMLGCGHYFCKTCLDKLQRKNENVCPICKEIIDENKIRVDYV